jgi:hypothetical protein
MYEFILWIAIIVLISAAGLLALLLYRLNQQYDELQDDLYNCYLTLYDYQQKINGLFEMNIHYYDETIFQFIESTKEMRAEIEGLIKNHPELQILADQAPAEQPQEILGVSRPLIYNRKVM